MGNPINETPKSPVVHLQSLNLIIALCAGLISVVGGVYSLKSTVFASPKIGSLQGIVIDENIAKPLWQAPVEISEASNGAVVALINTDQIGHYSAPSLKEGDYIVKASAQLHKTQTKNIKIYSKTEATVNFELPAEKQKSESVMETARTHRDISGTSLTNSQQPYGSQIAPISQSSPYNAVPNQGSFQTNPNSSAQLSTNAAYPTTMPRQHHRRQYPGASADSYSNSYGSNQAAGNYSNQNMYNNPDTSVSQPSNSTSSTSSSSALTQVAGQLLQSWASKKLGSNSNS